MAAKIRPLPALLAIAAGLVSAAVETGEAPSEYPALSSISRSMLFYKFAPETFDREELLERAANQVSADQSYYSGSFSAKDQEPLFSKAQVAGRKPDFAALELLDEYQDKLAQIASELPTRYSGVIAIESQREARYDHGRGMLHKQSDSGFLVREPIEAEPTGFEDRALYDFRMARKLSSTGDIMLLSKFGYRVSADQSPAAETPLSMAANVPPPGGAREFLLALDRVLEVPAIPLPVGDAERMLAPPAQGLWPHEPGYEEAQQERKEYLEAFLFFFDIELVDLQLSGRYGVLTANVLGAKLLGTRGELLRTFTAADFTTPAQVRDEQLAMADKERAAQAAKEAERDRSELAKLAALNVLGIRPGMPVEEAESLLRGEMDVQSVYSFSAPPPSRHAAAATAKRFAPYDNGLLFVANGGDEVVALFYDQDRELLGVTRRMSANGLARDRLESALIDKYGDPTRADNKAWIWGQTGKRNVCAGPGAIDAGSTMELLEGEPVANVTYAAAGIGVTTYWPTADELAACRTVLQVSASLVGTSKPRVEFRLHDHSAVASALKAMEDKSAADAESAAKDLTF